MKLKKIEKDKMGGFFVAVGSNKILTSSDGISWTKVKSGFGVLSKESHLEMDSL